MATNKNYESIFILKPTLERDACKKKVDYFIKLLKQDGATHVKKINMDIRTLAYPIAKFEQGHYYQLLFQAEPTIVDKIEAAYKREEGTVIRFMTLALSKEAIAYNNRKKNDKEEHSKA